MTISLDENLAFAKTLPEHSVTKVPVLCHRCGAKADCEAPRAPEEDVIYYCGGCQSDLLRKPHLPPGYELVRELGRGGMGAIFLIHSLAQDELRAMKVMLPHVAMAAENRQLFLREARRHATLSHKNVVLLHDTHELHPGVFCMVMEYVEGGSAADKLKRSGGRGLPQKEAVAIISQALSGLDHAHTRGIVHRDIKEANLLIGSGPTPVIKLADFGLAKSFEEAGATSLNSSAVVAGTVGYMAPEQITDFRNVGTSADVYSVGATLYSLLTGALPYDFLPSADPMPNLLKVLEEPVVPLRQRRPDVSEALAAAVDRALLRDPKHRFTTALEMQSAILSAV